MKRTRCYGFLALIGLFILGAVYEFLALRRIDSHNQSIAILSSGRDVPLSRLAGAPPEVRLARAVYFHGKRRYDDALATLNMILDQGDAGFRARVRYNLGNLHLSHAVEKVEGGDLQQAIPLVELAKAAYREALAMDSRFWDAKYNFEVAMRLLPEMDRVDLPEEGEEAQEDSLWTTVPGFPRGLP